MNLFQLKSKPHGTDRFQQFINEKFVCIGWPGLGNLEQVSKEEIKDRIEKNYGYKGHKLGNALGHVNAFVNTMKSGDVVIITERIWAYLGIVTDYEYIESFDNDQDAMCHRRKVEWLNRVKITDFDPSIQRFIIHRNLISRYPEAIDKAWIERYTGKKPSLSEDDLSKLDNLFKEALQILEEELKSEDPERRIKAASEILRLKSRGVS